MTRRSRPLWAIPGLVVMYAGMIIGVSFVAVQILLIRPALDRRVDLIMQGAEVASSTLHNLYGAIELGKLVLLVTVAWIARSGVATVLVSRCEPHVQALRRGGALVP